MTYIHSGYRAVQYTSLGMGLALLVAYALEYATLRSIVRAKPGKSAPSLRRYGPRARRRRACNMRACGLAQPAEAK
jgi:hypothetical protein